MAMVGRGKAVTEIGSARVRVLGPVSFLAWLGLHAQLLPGWSQRAGAVTSWCRDYLSHTRPQVVVYQPDAYERERSGKPEEMAAAGR